MERNYKPRVKNKISQEILKMKKFKLNILQVFILLFSLTAFITSCTSDSSETQIEENLENLNTLENRQVITDLFTKGTSTNIQLEELALNRQLSRTSDEELGVDEALLDYEQCSDCNSEYKNFLMPLFQEVKDLGAEDIISKIEEYELSLEQSELDAVIKDNLNFTLFSFKETALYVIQENSNTTRRNALSRNALSRSSCGKALGRGIVTGFAVGCIRGGIAGAAGGTVALPLVGTATGAVGGCIFGGAAGAVITGFTSWFWCKVG